MNPPQRRQEALRSLSVASNLLEARDIEGCKHFISEALLSDPSVPGAEPIVAAAEVLRSPQINNHPDYYSVLGLNSLFPSQRDSAAVSLHYQRLSLLLHREPPTPAFGDAARLVREAWNVLSDPVSKAVFDRELELEIAKRPKTPPPRAPSPNPPRTETPNPNSKSNGSKRYETAPKSKGTKEKSKDGSKPTKVDSVAKAFKTDKAKKHADFWTMCKTCCHVHLYGHLCEGQYLLCHSCNRPFFASAMKEPPPIVPDSDMYYCSWGFFPLGFPGGPGYGGMVGQTTAGMGPVVPAGHTGGENGTLGTEPVRRRPGRPKKNKTTPNSHSSDIVEATVHVPVIQTPNSEPVRRGRGRPAKVGRTGTQMSPVPIAVQELALVPVIDTPSSEPMRRGRGRPKKTESGYSNNMVDKKRANADRKKVTIDIN